MHHRIDWLGSLLATLAIAIAVYAIVEATTYTRGSTHVPLPGAVAIVLAVAFFTWESCVDNPIMPLRISRLPGLVGASIVRGFLVTGMYGV